MTTKEFHDLKAGDIILKGKRKAEVTGLGPSYVEFRFLDTKRPSLRGYRGLKSTKVERGQDPKCSL